MPNGGPRPDCIHCKHYGGGPFSHDDPYCELHKMDLPFPLYAFCANYVDPEPQDKDWLDQELDRDQFRKDMMYIWRGGYEIKFVAVPLAPIAEYGTWTQEQFFDEVHKLQDTDQNG